MEIFIEITIILAMALGVSMLMRVLKQPLIIGYILTGIIVGPYAFNLVHSEGTIELFSKLGITILLFIVGLSLNPSVIKEVGKVSAFTGIAQVVFTSAIGFIIALVLGIDRIAAIYVAIGLTFSSTIIILKLLSDKGDINKLYGRIAIGFLIVQDVIATIILLVTSAVSQSDANTNIALFIGYTLMKGVFLITIVMTFSNIVLPRIQKFIAASQELLFIFSITWGLGFAVLFYYLGFSVEIGALVAGVAMSMTPYAYEVSSRLRPLRDFFIVLFFILLGSQMVLDNIFLLLFPAAILSLFVLIGNPIIVIILMNLLGYSKRTGFQTGLTVAQISEFSLILAALGFQVGHISREVLSLITLVGLITIAGSTYLILYSDKIYPRIENILTLFALRKNKREKGSEEDYEAILFGYQRVGTDFIKSFEKLGFDFIVVDFDPTSIDLLEEKHIAHKYGDAKDPEFLNELELKKIKYVVSTIPDHETNVMLINKIRQLNKRAIILVIAQTRDETHSLYEVGATYVIVPHYLGAQYASKLMTKYGVSKHEYNQLKKKHIQYLKERMV